MPAPQFSVNAYRFDPYRTFKFQVVIDNVVVAGMNKATGLKTTMEAVDWRSSIDQSYKRKLIGGATYDAITLDQGLSHDPIFQDWINLVNNIDGDASMSLTSFRKDIVINLLNLQGAPVLSYKVFRAWPSEFQAMPDLDAGNTNTVGIQMLKLENEGWRIDDSVTEPTES
ncbi:MAG: phage tail protein [Pseudomonadales bacterium]